LTLGTIVTVVEGRLTIISITYSRDAVAMTLSERRIPFVWIPQVEGVPHSVVGSDVNICREDEFLKGVLNGEFKKEVRADSERVIGFLNSRG
jgi:hypothetical protein